MKKAALAGLLVSVGLALGHQATSDEVGVLPGQPPLTVASPSGALTRSQMQAFIEPYRQARGRWVNVESHDGGLQEIRSQVGSLNVKWDVVSLELADATRGCTEGLIEPIDASILPAGPGGTPARSDFFEGALQECAVGQAISSTVIAYDPDRYPQAAPSRLADFFDLERFPGPRGLRKSPRVNLEWALMADGVPPGRVYERLASEEGLQQALAKLNSIKTKIVWWTEGEEPVRLLESGKVAMSSVSNSRIRAAVKERRTKPNVLVEGQVWTVEVWSILKGSRRLREAMDFIAFASSPERQALQAELIDYAYAPARRSALALMSPAIHAALPAANETQQNALRLDEEWWAGNGAEIEARFAVWLAEGPKPYDFRAPDRQ